MKQLENCLIKVNLDKKGHKKTILAPTPNFHFLLIFFFPFTKILLYEKANSAVRSATTVCHGSYTSGTSSLLSPLSNSFPGQTASFSFL